MGFLPGGNSSITLTSRSPYIVIAKVRGIGVAVITKTWGGCALFPHILALWATPKRCCSSTTATPNRANWTLSSITACVPTRIWTSPFSSRVRMSSRFFPFTVPVNNSTCTSKPFKNEAIVVKCCSANISVGAIKQAWKSLSIAMSMVIKATRVLPDPTSPCNKRFICLPVIISLLISFITRFWALVSGKGKLLV